MSNAAWPETQNKHKTKVKQALTVNYRDSYDHFPAPSSYKTMIIVILSPDL